jgi:hypothetical protein
MIAVNWFSMSEVFFHVDRQPLHTAEAVAEDFSMRCVGDHLHGALVRVDDGGLGVRREGELAGLDLVAQLLGPGFREADDADLGSGTVNAYFARRDSRLMPNRRSAVPGAVALET